jgi:hypothetical protein
MNGPTITSETFADDGSVSFYADGEWLCNEETKALAKREAGFILTAIANGAEWARAEYPVLSAKYESPAMAPAVKVRVLH